MEEKVEIDHEVNDFLRKRNRICFCIDKKGDGIFAISFLFLVRVNLIFNSPYYSDGHGAVVTA